MAVSRIAAAGRNASQPLVTITAMKRKFLSLLLALCAVAAFARRRRPEAQALTLAILGATAYLLLFEVWPRYLFVFAPLYVLLATMALDRPLFARTGEKRQKA